MRSCQVLRELDNSQLRALLFFSTGSSRVPLGGFAQLPLTDPEFLTAPPGSNKTYTIDVGNEVIPVTAKLPAVSTCFNTIQLPRYASKQALKDNLLRALEYGLSGYDGL